MKNWISINGSNLTLEKIAAVARLNSRVKLDASVPRKMAKSLKTVEQMVRQKKRVYGVTTGFGSHSGYFIANQKDAQQLQENIIVSHLVSVGDFLPDEVVRAAMVIRANTLAAGFSGIRPVLLQRLISLINKNIAPLIPEKGSVGASGDLSPLAYVAHALLGKGQVRYRRKIQDAASAFRKAGLRTEFKLSYKEGVSLTNGTTIMTALGVLSYLDAVNLMKAADIAAALTAEAILARSAAFDAKLHQVRPHAGQILSAKNFRRLTRESKLLDRGSQIQDSYSIRCVPQVHGASWEALEFVKKILQTEINSVSDNPLLFGDRAYSGGNFHGQPLALALDFLGMALAEMGNISERRIQKLLDAHHNNGLPANLVSRPGLNSGLMIAQYTAAALVSENKVLAHPASVDSIPTSANVEDHVSMGTHAARKAAEILANVQAILAIELMCAAQGVDFRTGKLPVPQDSPVKVSGTPGEGSLVAHKLIRQKVKAVFSDRQLDCDINALTQLVKSEELTQMVEKKTGKLYR
ncbi:MAG: histidine ammonia-lyase [candidate division Zixibacteria bacterium]|nr:histidine ammonia-lyase [candidate division Zixibacteria bacterium]